MFVLLTLSSGCSSDFEDLAESEGEDADGLGQSDLNEDGVRLEHERKQIEIDNQNRKNAMGIEEAKQRGREKAAEKKRLQLEAARVVNEARSSLAAEAALAQAKLAEVAQAKLVEAAKAQEDAEAAAERLAEEQAMAEECSEAEETEKLCQDDGDDNLERQQIDFGVDAEAEEKKPAEAKRTVGSKSRRQQVSSAATTSQSVSVCIHGLHSVVKM